MRKIKTNQPRHLLIAVVFAGILLPVLFYQTSSGGDRMVPEATEAATAPQIRLTGICQTHIRQNKKQWVLTAESAALSPDGKTSVLNNIELKAFQAAETPVRITAESGLFDRNSKALTISGNVILCDGKYKIHTSSLHYRGKTDTIYTNAGVVIYSDTLHLTGKTMHYDLVSTEAVLTGSVRGVLQTASDRQ